LNCHRVRALAAAKPTSSRNSARRPLCSVFRKQTNSPNFVYLNHIDFGVDNWFAVGILPLGAGLGALVTAIFYSAQIHRLRSQIQTDQHTQDHAA